MYFNSAFASTSFYPRMLLAFGFNGAGFSEFKIPNAGGHWAIYRNLEIEHIIAKRASGSGGAADMHRAPGPRTVKQLGGLTGEIPSKF
jgi:hypothetical protein